jgi:hypothetical protein
MPPQKIPEAEIVTVLWIENGHHIEVGYVNGQAERRHGDQMIATELAESAGLRLVSTPKGMVRWVRNPDSWQTR